MPTLNVGGLIVGLADDGMLSLGYMDTVGLVQVESSCHPELESAWFQQS